MTHDSMKIKEVSALYNLTADTLRYYERIGLIRNVPRTLSGNRDYTQENCDTIAFIKCMRAANVSIDGLCQYIDLYHQGDKTREARKEILLHERAKLTAQMQSIQQALEKLDKKIAMYENGKECTPR